MTSALPYRPNVGIALFNPQGLVFAGRSHSAGPEIVLPGFDWQMPQGGIDPGEDPRRAALRELEEEIGTANAAIIAEADGWLSYDLPVELAKRVWGGRYRGQAQKWFAARFLGEDAEIDLEKHHQPEFSAWRWAPSDVLPTAIVGFKRDLYGELVIELGPKISAALRAA